MKYFRWKLMLGCGDMLRAVSSHNCNAHTIAMLVYMLDVDTCEVASYDIFWLPDVDQWKLYIVI